ncbi:Alkaline phosphatase [Enhygromyxa salina]|uniref:Alkaline phosphatase n=1 Tax=Enhygromyxa salina TaxID=215803 RepID=A0A0C2D599_9BACT|nr:Alkaline phosphatase [Enhygromyxa salina]
MAALSCLLSAGGCGGGAGQDTSPFATGTSTGTLTQTGASDTTGGDGDGDGDSGDGDGDPGDGDGDETLFDVAEGGGDGDGDGDCTLPHVPCDAATTDPFNALGLGCPGELQINPSIDAHQDGMGVRSSFGATATYDPQEGSSYFVLSTGHVAELDDEPVNPGDQIYHCNKWFSPGDGMDTTNFPAPIKKNNVNGDCLSNPALVGTGDCSNTIQAQFQQSGWKYDYQEIRFSVTVPEDAHALAFDVAYFTTEWPVFAGQSYNDMFIAWLEAPNWTGNISFDDGGHALSLNAAFFDYEDQDGLLPEFAGTCMRYGAGTPWLTTTAEVVPGDQIELVFAIFDLDDVNLDSFVFLDNFRWLCEGGGGPSTMPVPVP